MRVFQKSMIVAGAALLLAAGTAGVFAQAADKSAALKERQDFMEAQQKNVGAMQAFAKGTGDRQGAIDGLTRLTAQADELQAKLAAFFPAGTSMTDFPGKTYAKPELWQNIDKIKADLPKLKAAEVKLMDVVKTADADTVGKAASSFYRESCNGICHDSYRAPKEKKE